MKSLGFAIIGCGRIAGHHMRALRELPGARLVAICDLIPERGKAYQQEFSVPWYDNYHTLLRREDVDVVSILTPNGMHPSHAIDIMNRYAKHVVVEKPLALKLNDLPEMQSAARRAGVKVFPVFQNRYNKAVCRVNQAITGGELGRLSLGSIRLRWCRTQPYYERDAWRGTWALDGGALVNQGIHYLDLLLHFMGEVESACAMTATRLVDIEVEDVAVAQLRFTNGALGNIEVTTATRPKDIEASVSVLGEHGTAVLGGIASNRLEVWTLNPEDRDRCSEEFPDAYGFGHRLLLADVIADLSGGPPHPISFYEGSRSVQLLNALYRSAEDKMPVFMKDKPVSRRLGEYVPDLYRLYESLPP
ncbi:MAG: Gfo/Idh/MocA family oxidoreductase [Verrucomicrobia bacterium]|nr:Gfo/Idh/MocA family oxidoreductase [Verrucomicrobiota bacterium]